MKTYEEKNYDNNSPYPMHFTMKRDLGKAEITLCHNEVLEVGDILEIQKADYEITEVLESREPAPKTKDNPTNVNHHPEGVMWYKVAARYLVRS